MKSELLTLSRESSRVKSHVFSNPSLQSQNVADADADAGEDDERYKLYEVVLSDYEERSYSEEYIEHMEACGDEQYEVDEVVIKTFGGYFAKNETAALEVCAICSQFKNFSEMKKYRQENIEDGRCFFSAVEVVKLPINVTVPQKHVDIRREDWTKVSTTGILVLSKYIAELELQALSEVRESRQQLAEAQCRWLNREELLISLLRSCTKSLRQVSKRLDCLLM